MSDNRKKMLVLAHFYPYAPNSGAAIRMFNMTKDLFAHFDIYFMSFIDAPLSAVNDELGRFCAGTFLVPRNRPEKNILKKALSRALRYFRVALCFRNPVIEEHRSRELENLLKQNLPRYNFDLVMVESSWMAQYIPLVRSAGSACRIVLDLFDLNSRLLEERVRLAGNILTRAYRWFLYRTMRRHEKKYIGMADAVLAASAVELEKARELAPQSKFIEIPNYISLDRYAGYGSIGTKRNSLVFTGWMAAFFNESAILYFCAKILPLIRARGLDPVLHIVGGSPGKKIRALAEKDAKITVSGYAEDAMKAVAGAEVFVVPNIEGSGTRIKILEALAMGKPVVSTPKGCEGLKVTDGEDILVRSTPEGFADAVIGLLEDQDRGQRLAKRGKELVASHYSSSVWGGRLAAALKEIGQS